MIKVIRCDVTTRLHHHLLSCDTLLHVLQIVFVHNGVGAALIGKLLDDTVS